LLRKCALCLLLALAALAAPIAAHADSPPQPIPADGKCAVPVDPSWTKQEQFVWLNVCAGKEADFNKGPDYGGDLDPKSPTGLPKSRILRSSFLETILLKDKYRSALTRLGVHIIGARFTDTVDLWNAELQHDLWLDRSLLEKDVNLRTVKTSRRITFDGTKVIGTFSAAGSQIDNDLSMTQAEFSENVDLSGVHIGTHLNLSGSTIAGVLNLNTIDIHQNLNMSDKAKFKDIDLIGAHIGGQLVLNGSTVTGMLNMNQIHVEQALFMRDNAQFNEINLASAHIDGMLDLSGSTVTGKWEGQYIHVAGTVSLGSSIKTVEGIESPLPGAIFKDKIYLTSAKLGQDFFLSDGTFNEDVDLTGTQIGGVIVLQSTRWLGSATLNLTGAAAGRIDLSHAWPEKMYLNEFTYRNLSNISKNTSQQAKIWFGKQVYAPQPYQQLASVLQANGWITDATAIRYAGKEHEQKTTPWGLYKAWLVLLHYSIGFGYHLEYAFGWAVVWVLLGWRVLFATGQKDKNGVPLGLAYSFDMLLPLVQLRKEHYDIELDPRPQRYFYVHKIVGIVLASFIAAGISGLTK
jgi:hypothetical protein